MKHCIKHRLQHHMQHHRQRPMLGALCALLLGTALSAYSCAPRYFVFFDRNNNTPGATEASPPFQTVESTALHLGALPTQPTRPGYQFVGWNTQADGAGVAFGVNTPVTGDVTVYAQWEAVDDDSGGDGGGDGDGDGDTDDTATALGVEVFPPTAVLSPVEPSVTFSLRVSGFERNEAGHVQLSISAPLPVQVLSMTEEIAKRFIVTVHYGEQTVFEGGEVLVHFALTNVPEGYAATTTHTLRVPIRDGLDKHRPIPVRAANLLDFNTYANTPAGLARHYRLVEHVSLPEPLLYSSNPERYHNNWTPVGTEAAPFAGSFDGDNHTVSGLSLNVPPSNLKHLGIFGVINRGAVIQNLGVLDVNIVNCLGIAGGLVGKNNGGRVDNCHVEGKFKSECGGLAVGGVVGENSGLVRSCHADVDIYGSGGHFGGVVGINTGTVTHSYAAGDLSGAYHLGGVVGENHGGIVQNSYATNDINSHGNPFYGGGVVGLNNGTVRNCYSTGNVYGSYIVGGVVGVGGEVHNSYFAGTLRGGWGGIRGIGGALVRNSVALNPEIRAYLPVPGALGRVGGGSSYGNNYARADMRLYENDIAVYLEFSDTGLNTKHGERLYSYSANYFFWWAASDTWSTRSSMRSSTGSEGSAWDFENDWEWSEANLYAIGLPILRDVGGVQAPRLLP